MSETTSLAQQVFLKMMDTDYCSQWMGIEPILLKEGHCQLRMTVKRDMLNGFGILHGGVAYAFADSALAFASNSYGRLSVSIQGSMNFSQSAKEGETLIADAQALELRYKTATFDVNVRNEKGEVYYRFRGTVYRSSKEVLDSSSNDKKT